jgi:PAS domain S-box-containing protein
LEKTKGVVLALAILDVRMPGMSGYDLALRMNEVRYEGKVPIIFLTARHIDEIELFKGYVSGAIDYLLKPANKDILLSKINVFLDLFNQKQTVIQKAAQLKQAAKELTRVNAELKISEEKYKTIINASPDGILLIDLNGIITEVSEIGLELLGANTRDDLIGKDFSRFLPSDEKDTIKEIIEKTISEGLLQNISLKMCKINQSVFANEMSTTLIQDPYGLPLSFMIILRDISQRKKIETKQIHADRMANLGEMASGIAHEINQPLNIISMVMDKILFESDKTKTVDIKFLKTKSNKIFENIIRIRNIIDHIRAFSRSHDDYVLSAFDINSSIGSAVSMIVEQFKHLGINLNLQLEKQIPEIFGNTYKFEQVIINLLNNAKDAVIEKKNQQEENYEIIVGIKSYLENQFIIVEVTDNGIGISHEDINNIILPFYTTKDEGKGTGIGLSICYQIIKEMNGNIEITSDSLEGTKIKLVLDTQKRK